MFKVSSRTCSEYSLKSVPMPSALIMLSLATVEPDYRICGEDRRRIRKFQLANPAYDKLSVIDVIIKTDIYSFLSRDGS